ncbi:esterase/lipase family protein [Salinisphaera sp. RV14]|uniref:esterase/lipase family protein n=1 Tax=unclassified Salinisphaera TaxID=2649847 RepID=UPI003F8336F5
MNTPRHTTTGYGVWLRGGVAGAADVYVGTVDLVENVHRTIADTGAAVNPVVWPERAISGIAYAGVRGIGRASFASARGLAGLTRGVMPDDSDTGGALLALRSALNGAVGDHLAARGNELALPMVFVGAAGRTLANDDPRGLGEMANRRRLVLLVHGLGMNDRQWRQGANPDFGERLAVDHGYAALRLRYNSGRDIAINGTELAARLERLVAAWPAPLERLTAVGHSMGGLVLRAALEAGRAAGHRWPDLLADLICLGSPHRGAPLERLGESLNRGLTWSRYTRAFHVIGDARSAGVKNLRHGLPPASRSQAGPPGCFLVAASLGRSDEDPVGRVLGDLLVPVDSAFDHPRALRKADVDGCVFYGMTHFALIHHADVYVAIREWLAPRLGEPVRRRTDPARR